MIKWRWDEEVMLWWVSGVVMWTSLCERLASWAAMRKWNCVEAVSLALSVEQVLLCWVAMCWRSHSMMRKWRCDEEVSLWWRSVTVVRKWCFNDELTLWWRSGCRARCQAAEEQRLKEDKERQEHEEYLRLKADFCVESEGVDAVEEEDVSQALSISTSWSFFLFCHCSLLVFHILLVNATRIGL